MFALATMLSEGRGMPRSEEQAFVMFRRAAEHGDAEAQWEVGDRFVRGKGTTSDIDSAREWFLKAADQGYPAAQNSLGNIFSHGLCRDGKDEEEALRWFSRAAWQYHAPGMKSMGDMFLHGRGVERDDFEAARWYRLAIEQGADYAPALKALGDLYSSGRGVFKDSKKALQLYGLAAGLQRNEVKEAEAVADRDRVPQVGDEVQYKNFSTCTISRLNNDGSYLIKVPGVTVAKVHRSEFTVKSKDRAACNAANGSQLALQVQANSDSENTESGERRRRRNSNERCNGLSSISASRFFDVLMSALTFSCQSRKVRRR